MKKTTDKASQNNADSEKVIPLGFEFSNPREKARLALALRIRPQPILATEPLHGLHCEPFYGWELLRYRLGAFCPAHPLTQGFDFLPTLFPHSMKQFALFHNLFSSAGLWRCYDKVVVSMPTEIMSKLAAHAKTNSLGQHAYFYGRTANTTTGGNRNRLPPFDSSGAIYFIEGTAPELVALKEVPNHNLATISAFARPLAALAASKQADRTPQLPPRNGFIPWLESLAMLQDSLSTAETTQKLQLAELLPFLGSKTLFLCSVGQFSAILALTHSPEFLDCAEFMLQSKESGQSGLPVSFAGRRTVSLFKAAVKSRLEFSATLPFDLSEFTKSAAPNTSIHSDASSHRAPASVCPDELMSFCLERIFQEAMQRYESWTKFKLRRAALDALQQFLAKMLNYEQKTSLSAFDLVLAAKACVDGNFSAKIAETLEDFASPLRAPGTGSPMLEELIVKLSDVFPNTEVLEFKSFVTFEHIKSQSSRPKVQKGAKSATKEPFARPVKLKSDAFKTESFTGSQLQNKSMLGVVEELKAKYKDKSWVDSESGYHCSFPDEDFFLDTAVYNLTQKTKSQFHEKSEKSVPLESSLEDGIDIRNTIRNWHSGNLYVLSHESKRGSSFGAIVYDFTTAVATDSDYSWKALWNAEEHDATHLMFFATPFRDEIIGPGIARSTFGGFAALPSENRVYDLWNHGWLKDFSQSSAEHLLLAAAFCSVESTLIYVGQKMPRRALLEVLRQNQKHLVFVSMATIDQNQIRRLRTFHVLAEPSVRIYAQSFIQKDSGS